VFCLLAEQGRKQPFPGETVRTISRSDLFLPHASRAGAVKHGPQVLESPLA
jgi:hypothetical protein